MNTKILDQLEFNKVKDQFTEYLQTEQAQAELRNLVPMTNPERIQNQFTEIQEMAEIFVEHHGFAIGSLRDISEPLRRLELDADLNIQEFIAIKKVLQASADLGRFYADLENVELVALKRLFEKIEAFPSLQGSLQSINDGGFIEHFASPELQNIRRQLKSCDDAIRQTLQDILKKSGHMLAESLIASRNGRSVLPVKNTYRNRIAGVVHDISSSGNTVYIEPRAVIQLNEEITQLRADERHEMARILHELSDQLRPQAAAIANNAWILGHMDFIRGKYLYLQDKKAVIPKISDNQTLQLLNVRHPLLVNPVANDLRFDEDLTAIVITGPNTGGKTVMLKTLGLAQLMAQSGLPILADKGSRVAIFQEIFADIGDEQSIEQSLSTFSSHMTHIVEILDAADSNSLVLVDELGAGTDPVEGAALATAILSDLHNRHSTVMATTHYSELKLYALQTPDVENACCEFDVTTLRPTYKLLIGVPGKSNAFAISSKLGLPDRIIEDAKDHVASDAKHFEDVLAELEKTRVQLEKEHAAVSKSRKEISDLKKSLKEKNEKIDNSKDKILKHANEEASRILAEAKDYADETIRKYTKWASSDKHIKEMEAQRAALREKLDSKQSKIKVKKEKTRSKQLKASDLYIGADIKVLSLGANGTVSTLPNEKGDLFVQAGLLRTKVNIKDIELLPKQKTAPAANNHSGSGKIRMNKASGINGEINLIGMTVDQAMPVLEKYLDDAYLAHMTQVTVIHGRGTGALRTATHNHLKRTKYVKSFRLGEFGEGDMGVTIVNFK